MIITAKGASRADGSPKDVDREFVIAFYEFLEVESRYAPENIAKYMLKPEGVRIIRDPFGAKAVLNTDENDEAPVRTLLRETLNGYYYGNLPMLTMEVGEKVRWYIMGTTNFEVHAPHWHGNTFRWRDMYADTIPLLTMGMETLDMEPDNPGIWLFHCHVGVHFEAGMVARYEVVEAGQ